MKTRLGEEGTEQFHVEVSIDGQVVHARDIHDPFITTGTSVVISRWDHFMAIFRRREIKFEARVRGTLGAEHAVMLLDPMVLSDKTRSILNERAISRDRHLNSSDSENSRPAIWRLGTDLAAEEAVKDKWKLESNPGSGGSYTKKVFDAYHKE